MNAQPDTTGGSPADCLFCKINQGTIPAEKVFENDGLFAIRDINPQAPTHLLIIPKKHFSTLLDLQTADQELIGSIYTTANQIAKEEGISQSGFRVVANCGADGGQSVYHIHFHLLGGRPLHWPPG